MPPSEPVPAAWLAGDALDAAHHLLGCELVRGEVVLRIVETEAYRWPDDTASHGRTGPTPRNAPMWGPPGRAYVYLCYGIHHLLNVSTGPEGQASAVLIRGAEVVAGHATVADRRGGRTGPGSLAGPGKVAMALGLDTSWRHHDLLTPDGLFLRVGPPPDEVLEGPRIGIDYARADHIVAPWRLADAAAAQVSHKRRLTGPAPRRPRPAGYAGRRSGTR